MVMTIRDLEYFIYSPYNRIADVKMLYFFTDMSATTLWVLIILLGLSIMVPFFWCRYLCPYGALQGALSLLSPWKIRRNPDTCTLCRKCSQACPSAIQVHKNTTALSDECLSCRQCLQACPEPNTLAFAIGRPKITPQTRRFYGKLSPERYAALLLTAFVIAWLLARATGNWHTQMSSTEYRSHIRAIDHPIYRHHRGQVAPYRPNKLKENGFHFDKKVKRILGNKSK
jgi:polyferredoxin